MDTSDAPSREIPGFPGYRATTDGEVFGPRGKLTGHISRRGYRRVCVRSGGQSRNHSVHVLVARAFLGERPGTFHVGHLDGDKLNNSVANLAYVSPALNEAQKALHGTAQIGSRRATAKLTEATARDLLGRHRQGARRADLARAFGVSLSTVDGVIYGRYWRHATQAPARIGRRHLLLGA